MNIIDFHTHAFPESLAERAIETLEENGGISAFHAGTIAALLTSMDMAGITQSAIASIATKPEQFDAILAWSRIIRSERIIPFLSIHPDDPAALEHIREIKDNGFKGIKMHPYYQGFNLTEERMFPIYETIAEQGLILLCHTGFDISFPRERKCDPEKIASLKTSFPNLTFVAAHCGGWQDWDEVEKHLVGKSIYLETSFALELLSPDQAKRILTNHPKEYLLFGSDSPWTDQKRAITLLTRMDLPSENKEAMLGKNAERVLGR